ncbi:MFS transporter [Streptomyces sp. NPDC051985]|uniref:MFS transporter n=1 Tax=Streptomyces sp. NPDC051985 TaxID=3155807 RepID=UPI00342B3482
MAPLPDPDPTPAPAPAERGVGLIFALSFSGITVAVMSSLLSPLLPRLPQLLDASASDATWAVTASLLSGAVSTPIAGRLGDLYGKRRMVLISLVLLLTGSLVSAFSSSLVPMIIGRTLQGSALGVIALGMGIMRDHVPPSRLNLAIGLMSSSLGAGVALGPTVSAAIVEYADWHMVFAFTAGLGAASIALVLRYVPAQAERRSGGFDLVGTVGLSAGLVALLLAISKGGDWGWSSIRILALFGVTPVILALWAVVELRAPMPLVDLRTARLPVVLLTNITSLLVGYVLLAQSMVMPQLLQLDPRSGSGLGLSVLAAGLVMLPGGLMMMAVSALAARLSSARGPKTSLVVGAGISTVGYLVGLTMMHAVWQVMLTGIVISTGIATAYAAMPSLIMSAVPASESGAANGFNALMRAIGTSTSSAVAGVVLARTRTPFDGLGTVPTLTGFRIVFIIAAGAGVLAVLIGSLIPAHPVARQPAYTPSSPPPSAPATGPTATAP